MRIITKTRDPKTTDFKKNEMVINIKEGSLFYKSNLGLHKVTTTSTQTTVATETEDGGEEVALDVEAIQDIVGEMFTNNVQDNITSTYIDNGDGDGTIDLSVPVQVVDDDGEVIEGNFYSIGLSDNDGVINAIDSDLILKANHPNNQTSIDSDKASIILKGNEAQTEINGDLITINNTTDIGDNPTGIGKIQTAPEANITAGGNIRANKFVVYDPLLGNEWYLGIDYGYPVFYPCTEDDPCN